MPKLAFSQILKILFKSFYIESLVFCVLTGAVPAGAPAAKSEPAAKAEPAAAASTPAPSPPAPPPPKTPAQIPTTPPPVPPVPTKPVSTTPTATIKPVQADASKTAAIPIGARSEQRVCSDLSVFAKLYHFKQNSFIIIFYD